MDQQLHTGKRAGTIGGTLFCLVLNLHWEDFLKTIILAAVGAVVSFVVSLAMKHILKRFQK